MAEQENLELSYLQSDKIGKVLAKGIANLYVQQPKFPVEYLAKWLLNYSSAQKAESQLEQQQAQKEALKKEYQDEQTKIEEENKNQEIEKQNDLQKDEDFRQVIRQHEYHNELIQEELPQFLEERKGLTGCYIGHLDFSVRDVNDENEDESAHLNKEDPKVINYIGYSQSQQQLMSGKTLGLEQGVTAEVFKEKEAEEPQGGEEGQEGEPVVKPPNYVYIPDLVKEPRMHYFRLPKLGAYLALPLIYNSCLNEAAFDAGLEERQRFKIAYEEYEKEKEQKELDFNEQIKTAEENGESTEELQEQFKAALAELIEPEQAAFLTEKQEYVICCDTMGQDKGIEKENIEYLEQFAQLFAQQWQETENKLLSDDIDRQIQYLDSLPAKPSDLVEQFNEQEEQNAQDKEGNFAELKEQHEKEYNYELDCARLDKIREQLLDKTNQEYFIQLKDFRVIKFSGIIQNILYLLGYRREEINLPNTHILNWKVVRSKYINDQFFEKLLNYSHRGAKPGQVPVYSYVNRITEKIAKYEQEVVDNYNITFGRLLKWLKLTCQLRKLDIEIRREKIAKSKQDRQDKIDKNEQIREKKEKELEEKKAEIQNEEEKEAFDEAEWEKQFDEENPLEEIPDEVQDEEDDDCEFLE